MNCMDNIANALNKYRLQRKWKYRQLAAATGVPISTLHSIIKRGQRPNELTRHILITGLPGLEELCDAQRCADIDSASKIG